MLADFFNLSHISTAHPSYYSRESFYFFSFFYFFLIQTLISFIHHFLIQGFSVFKAFGCRIADDSVDYGVRGLMNIFTVLDDWLKTPAFFRFDSLRSCHWVHLVLSFQLVFFGPIFVESKQLAFILFSM